MRGCCRGEPSGRLHYVPGEIFRAPRSCVEKFYPHVICFNEAGEDGHFAAWEDPQLFAEEVRAGSGRSAR